MHGCTSIMRNFLPQARVLARSFLQHHPDARMSVFVVDGTADLDGEPFELLLPSDLGVEIEEVHRILTLFDGAGPSGAFRGALMRHLLQADKEPILFLDADTRVFESLHDAHRLAERHGVVLSPHFLDPPKRHEGFGGDRSLLLAGAFNSGLLAVGSAGAKFLRWWAARLQRWTLNAQADGYYGAQRWLDLVPAMFPHHVLDDPGCNVMTVNAHERALSSSDGRWFARERPLRLFHFGGNFDPHKSFLIGPGYAPREALFSEQQCLAELHRQYGESLLANGWDERPPIASSVELHPGVTLDRTMRAVYREALLGSEEAGSPEPPNPYTHGADAFLDWLRAPTDLRRNARTVSRYLHARWRDVTVSQAFPDLVGHDAERYIAFARSPEAAAAGFQRSLAEPIGTPSSPIVVRSRGINVVASDGGLAHFVGRRVTDELRATGERVAEVSYPRAAEARTQVSPAAAEPAINDVTIVCLRPGSVLDFDYDLGVLFRPGRHIVVAVVDSVWSPADLSGAMQIADDLWCWDEQTAGQVRALCNAHVEVLDFPVVSGFSRTRGHDVVCWADLNEPGHADALMARVLAHIDENDERAEPLRVHISGWYADPLVAETVWGIAESHACLMVQRVDGWNDALMDARAIVSLGSGIGPVEAQALRAGIEVIPATDRPGGTGPRADIEAHRGFGAAAAARLSILRSHAHQRAAP